MDRRNNHTFSYKRNISPYIYINTNVSSASNYKNNLNDLMSSSNTGTNKFEDIIRRNYYVNEPTLKSRSRSANSRFYSDLEYPLYSKRNVNINKNHSFYDDMKTNKLHREFLIPKYYNIPEYTTMYSNAYLNSTNTIPTSTRPSIQRLNNLIEQIKINLNTRVDNYEPIYRAYNIPSKKFEINENNYKYKENILNRNYSGSYSNESYFKYTNINNNLNSSNSLNNSANSYSRVLTTEIVSFSEVFTSNIPKAFSKSSSRSTLSDNNEITFITERLETPLKIAKSDSYKQKSVIDRFTQITPKRKMNIEESKSNKESLFVGENEMNDLKSDEEIVVEPSIKEEKKESVIEFKIVDEESNPKENESSNENKEVLVSAALNDTEKNDEIKEEFSIESGDFEIEDDDQSESSNKDSSTIEGNDIKVIENQNKDIPNDKNKELTATESSSKEESDLSDMELDFNSLSTQSDKVNKSQSNFKELPSLINNSNAEIAVDKEENNESVDFFTETGNNNENIEEDANKRNNAVVSDSISSDFLFEEEEEEEEAESKEKAKIETENKMTIIDNTHTEDSLDFLLESYEKSKDVQKEKSQIKQSDDILSDSLDLLIEDSMKSNSAKIDKEEISNVFEISNDLKSNHEEIESKDIYIAPTSTEKNAFDSMHFEESKTKLNLLPNINKSRLTINPVLNKTPLFPIKNNLLNENNTPKFENISMIEKKETDETFNDPSNLQFDLSSMDSSK